MKATVKCDHGERRSRDPTGVLGLVAFRLLWAAWTLSLVGDEAAVVATAFAMISGHRASVVGAAFAGYGLALVVGVAAGGLVFGRVSGRALMVCADVVRVVTQAGLAVAVVSGHASAVVWVGAEVLAGLAHGRRFRR